MHLQLNRNLLGQKILVFLNYEFFCTLPLFKHTSVNFSKKLIYFYRLLKAINIMLYLYFLMIAGNQNIIWELSLNQHLEYITHNGYNVQAQHQFNKLFYKTIQLKPLIDIKEIKQWLCGIFTMRLAIRNMELKAFHFYAKYSNGQEP